MQNFNSPRFSDLPEVTKVFIIINVAVFGIIALMPESLSDYWANLLALYFPLSDNFRPFQIITHMFMHGGLMHLFFNMFGLYMFGPTIERIFGSQRFFIYYIICGLGAAFFHYLITYYQFTNQLSLATNSPAILHQYYNAIPAVVGASGALYGVLLAYGLLFPNQVVYIYGIIPLKMKYCITLFVVIELAMGIQNTGNVAHFAHLGGMITGLFLYKAWGYKKQF